MGPRQSGRPLTTDPKRYPQNLSEETRTFLAAVAQLLEQAGLNYAEVCRRQGLPLEGKDLSAQMRRAAGPGEHLYTAILKTVAEAGGPPLEELHTRFDPLFKAAYTPAITGAPAPPFSGDENDIEADIDDVEVGESGSWLLAQLWEGTELADVVVAAQKRFGGDDALLAADLAKAAIQDRFGAAAFVEAVAHELGRTRAESLMQALRDCAFISASLIRSLIELPEPDPEDEAEQVPPLDPVVAGIGRRRGGLLARGAHPRVAREMRILLEDAQKNRIRTDAFDLNELSDEGRREEKGTHPRPACPSEVADSLAGIAASAPEGPELVAVLITELLREEDLTTVDACVTAVFDAYHRYGANSYAAQTIPALHTDVHYHLLVATCTEARLHDHLDGPTSDADLRALSELLSHTNLHAVVTQVVSRRPKTVSFGHLAMFVMVRDQFLASLMRENTDIAARLLTRALTDINDWEDPGVLPEDGPVTKLIVDLLLADPESRVVLETLDLMLGQRPPSAALLLHALLRTGNTKVSDILAEAVPRPTTVDNLAKLITIADRDDLPMSVFEQIAQRVPALAGSLTQRLATEFPHETTALLKAEIGRMPTFGPHTLRLLAKTGTDPVLAFAVDKLNTEGPAGAAAVFQAYGN
ncbi:hypothetical protein IU449_27725 [Nocardia higoensis]|uniref:Uncharacterized protein n=1 Tax=Nocardia higoensis TaxID=228599 RepID=A0ABS0DL64_9NOCA|nr:hypothetical protein [Nocardia higoensis]